ncbi:carboxymuconolactone decarboxylase family protein [Aquirhabdus parva]|uniref:Carboxymuconolactone decarboxylase family protein n=1 Tax=Aquirhabdus parva TaxID=2283318 RepID=A0A345P960_9GAMM|nr:carboxymuconolactone decarboxylase family protein [Aquirhabdus parva]AXI03819.1 carboxymuconolactone decarboxylase family protein [Aquirhabdus parva]
MTTTLSIDPLKNHPTVIQALYQAHVKLDGLKLIERKLHHLVVLRASQINGCAFCVKMHISEAKADGETQERLDRLIVWRHCDDYSAQEKAAFAWTEALTVVNTQANLEPLRQELVKYFSEEQISALTVTIGLINLWNRLQISQH